MINETTQVLEGPFNLATLSRVTNNPMMDVGYQCSDCRPYFKYARGTDIIYITIHPNNLRSQSINVYRKGTKNLDGRDYDSMTYVGNATATTQQTSSSTSTVTFGGSVYTWSGEFENIRGFYINKWAKYKPIQYGTEQDLRRTIEGSEIDDFVTHNCGLTIEYKDVPTPGASPNTNSRISAMLSDMKAGNFFWIYNPPTDSNWFRMTDFVGYNKTTRNPFFIEYVGGIGPIVEGVQEIYVDSTQDTVEVKITVGEESEVMLPANNVTTECLPTYFKREHGIGIVYEGRTTGFVDPFDPDSNDFLYPLAPGKSVQIPITITVGFDYTIGAYLMNKDSGDTGYYMPVKPLVLRFVRIPDLLMFDFSYYADRHDLVILATATRRGNTWWWGVHRADTAIVSARTVTNGGTFADLPVQVYSKKGNSQQWTNEANDDRAQRKVTKNGVDYEWNGCKDVNTQAGVDVPKSEIPAVIGTESITFVFRFVDLKDSEFVSSGHPEDYEVKIEGNLYLNTNDSGFRTQMMTLGKEVFEEIGWIESSSTGE